MYVIKILFYILLVCLFFNIIHTESMSEILFVKKFILNMG